MIFDINLEKWHEEKYFEQLIIRSKVFLELNKKI